MLREIGQADRELASNGKTPEKLKAAGSFPIEPSDPHHQRTRSRVRSTSQKCQFKQTKKQGTANQHAPRSVIVISSSPCSRAGALTEILVHPFFIVLHAATSPCFSYSQLEFAMWCIHSEPALSYFFLPFGVN
ncbi:hypothetical protein L484_014822 [Morus notabilis]|uniref:Uncharacterized protein n=1 Tax=Morus notabilis TaxID=981085 RepID=W9QEP9_9ROSA|nr:hypothetical protein L484_014822 [Morus notabilis]